MITNRFPTIPAISGRPRPIFQIFCFSKIREFLWCSYLHAETFFFSKSDWCVVWSWYIIWLVRRMILIFWLALRAGLGRSSEYLERGRKVRRKVSTSLWKKFSPQKRGFGRKWVSKRVGTFWPNPLFWGETFVSKAFRNVSRHFTTTFKVFRRSTQPSSQRQ